MGKKCLALLMLLFITYSATYAQNGVFTEERSVGAFDKISTCCGMDVYISEGMESAVRVETNYEEYLSRIKTEVKKGELKISFNMKDLPKRPNNMRVKVYVTATDLTGIHASSGSDIISQTPLFADYIKVSASSGADINIELTTNDLECKASSGSDITLKGRAVYGLLKASSGSDLNLHDMTINTVEASASSGSDIIVAVTNEIHAKASSGSDIVYKGTPKNVYTKKSIGGSVKQAK